MFLCQIVVCYPRRKRTRLVGFSVDLVNNLLPDIAQADEIRELEVDLGTDARVHVASMLERRRVQVILVHQQIHQVRGRGELGVRQVLERQADVDHVANLVVVGGQDTRPQDLGHRFTALDGQVVCIVDDGILAELLAVGQRTLDRHEGAVLVRAHPLELGIEAVAVVARDRGRVDQMLVGLLDVESSRSADTEQPLYIYT